METMMAGEAGSGLVPGGVRKWCAAVIFTAALAGIFLSGSAFG